MRPKCIKHTKVGWGGAAKLAELCNGHSAKGILISCLEQYTHALSKVCTECSVVQSPSSGISRSKQPMFFG